MISANLNEEKRLWKKGYKKVVCIDEAGRGTLAGPVVAAAVMLKIFNNDDFLIKKQFQNFKFKKLFKNLKLKIRNLQLRDSKKLSPRQREQFYRIITKSPFVEWGIGKVSEKVIDRINILEATKLAMERAVSKIFNFQFSITRAKRECSKKTLLSSLASFRYRGTQREMKVEPSATFNNDIFLILDGNFKLDLPIPQKSIIKADEKVFSCAAASILAKVTRDRTMKGYHKKYPYYGFNKHKGYPTRRHVKMLKEYGPSKIHRKTFGPVRALDFEKQSR